MPQLLKYVTFTPGTDVVVSNKILVSIPKAELNCCTLQGLQVMIDTFKRGQGISAKHWQDKINSEFSQESYLHFPCLFWNISPSKKYEVIKNLPRSKSESSYIRQWLLVGQPLGYDGQDKLLECILNATRTYCLRMGDGNGILCYLITGIPLKLHWNFIFAMNKLTNWCQVEVKSMYNYYLIISHLWN